MQSAVAAAAAASVQRNPSIFLHAYTRICHMTQTLQLRSSVRPSPPDASLKLHT